jgi:hypothetical protein
MHRGGNERLFGRARRSAGAAWLRCPGRGGDRHRDLAQRRVQLAAIETRARSWPRRSRGLGASRRVGSASLAGGPLRARRVELSLLGGHLPDDQSAFLDLIANVFKPLRALFLLALLLWSRRHCTYRIPRANTFTKAVVGCMTPDVRKPGPGWFRTGRCAPRDRAGRGDRALETKRYQRRSEQAASIAERLTPERAPGSGWRRFADRRDGAGQRRSRSAAGSFAQLGVADLIALSLASSSSGSRGQRTSLQRECAAPRPRGRSAIVKARWPSAEISTSPTH